MELLVIAALLYFVPWIIALLRRHQNAAAIFVLNLLLGWTFVGWVVALVWSMTATDTERRSVRHGFPNFFPLKPAAPTKYKKDFGLRGPEEEARFQASLKLRAEKEQRLTSWVAGAAIVVMLLIWLLG